MVSIKVEYAWKPITCTWGKAFGHIRKYCIYAPKEILLVPPIKKPPITQEWRQVSNCNLHDVKGFKVEKSRSSKIQPSSTCENSNVFAILAETSVAELGEGYKIGECGKSGVKGNEEKLECEQVALETNMIVMREEGLVEVREKGKGEVSVEKGNFHKHGRGEEDDDSRIVFDEGDMSGVKDLNHGKGLRLESLGRKEGEGAEAEEKGSLFRIEVKNSIMEDSDFGSNSPLVALFGNLKSVDEKDGKEKGIIALTRSQKKKLA
ncbi:hypothetical protein Pint_35838 [Pistacia integerrima]|uniref:Uncharacterized protein n=1 Tax=Pistacia integerrima TaxID=434235 RepID=A0ACC0XZR1_9ROSI|nr:hypothetical protein Pint_35838 [Pistacia integerrima]